MRPPQRHLSYAVSTVVGLVAPAAAALVLTSSTATFAAPAPPAPAPVVDEDPRPLLGRTGVYLPAPTPSPAAVRPVVKPVAKPRPVAAPKRVVRTATAKPTVRRATRPTKTTTAPVRRTRPVSQTAQPWGTNDYPYRTQSDFYAVDKWGFTQRQCVSFAAWRLAQHGDTISNKDDWGSALTWDEAARRLGHTATSRARVGAIAHWNAHEGGAYYSRGASRPDGRFTAGGYGHVGWVKQVYADGSALVEQYNMGNSRSYSVMRVKAPRYLLVG